MAKRRSQADHDAMVRRAAQSLEQQGFSDIRADLSGFTRPSELPWKGEKSGHVPDLTAQGKDFIVVEAETADSIADAHTDDQWKLFAAYADTNGWAFWIAVPTDAKAAANRRVEQLGIKAELWPL